MGKQNKACGTAGEWVQVLCVGEAVSSAAPEHLMELIVFSDQYQ